MYLMALPKPRNSGRESNFGVACRTSRSLLAAFSALQKIASGQARVRVRLVSFPSRHPLSRALGPVGSGVWPHAGSLTQFAPVLLIQLYFVLLRGGFDAFPGGIALSIGHPLHLLEAGDRVAHVSGVVDRFFSLLWESEVFVGDMIAASFSDLGHTSR